MVRRALLLAAALLWGTSGAASSPQGREPPDYEQIRRELRIGADVMRAALDDALPRELRLVELEAGYLADQGVLVIADLASPWFRMNDELDIDPEITSLEQIPDMVHEILTELNLGLSRHQVEDLQELREIRDAQRAVRAEQRALRARLRELGRERLRAVPPRAAELDRELAALEAELEAAAEEERALEQDAAGVRSTAGGPGADPEPAGRATVEEAIADAVCAYGATFKSLADDKRLNVVSRRGDAARYYVFEMRRVRACQNGDIDAATLLAEALRYGD